VGAIGDQASILRQGGSGIEIEEDGLFLQLAQGSGEGIGGRRFGDAAFAAGNDNKGHAIFFR
jgi:hypothetical protein